MIQLDERLSAAAELAGECAVFYDVGSNHGFLGAHLLQAGRAGARCSATSAMMR